MDLPSSIIFHLMIEFGGLKFPWSLHVIFAHIRERIHLTMYLLLDFFLAQHGLKQLGYLVFTMWRMNRGKLKSIDGLFIQNS